MSTTVTSLPQKRATSRPLDPSRALASALELAQQTAVAIVEAPQDFERSIRLMETVVARYRAAFLAHSQSEADLAIAYHDRANEEIREFVPMYYRLAVLENVACRYERAAASLQRALA